MSSFTTNGFFNMAQTQDKLKLRTQALENKLVAVTGRVERLERIVTAAEILLFVQAFCILFAWSS